MSPTDTEQLEAYVPFTPFESQYAFEAEPSPLAAEQPERSPVVTPFVSEYEGLETPVTAETQTLQQLLHELYDQEFDEALERLADEAWHAASDRAAAFGETVGGPSAEQFLQEWIDPLRVQAEALVDNVAEALAGTDPATLTEVQLDEIFERVEPRGTGLEPAFEDFLGGFGRALKKFARKAIKVAKSIVPIGLLLNQARRLLRPLLSMVIKKARDQLPADLQPLATQLAQKLFGIQAERGEDTAGAAALPDVSRIQREFDLQLASLLFAPEGEQQETVAQATMEAEAEAGPTVGDLHEARARFVDELQRGVAPEEALEGFLPAVMALMPVARTVLGIIGRQKFVRALAKPLAGFIGHYIDPAASGKLSQAIVDTGLRMISLEAPTAAEAEQLAPQALTAAVEDTVRRVCELDETVLEHPALFEAAVTEAFHEAAGENFPSELLIPELHEATAPGTWVSMPLRRGRKYYKKYSRVFEVDITPQIAQALKLRVSTPAHARVHLYQATFGTSYGRVARLEGGVHGLGRHVRGAWRLFHPLTVAAAGTLLGEPRLGRDHHRTRGRHRIPVGHRFYYLEIPTVRASEAEVSAARASEVNVTLDFPKDEFRIYAYLSEADAQDVAARLRRRDVTAAFVAVKRVYEAGLTAALTGDIRRHVRILSEDLPQEQLFGGLFHRLADEVKRVLARKVAAWVGRAVADYLQARAGELIAATEDPADGVTVVVTIVNPPGAPLVRKLLHGGIGLGDVAGGLHDAFHGVPRAAVQVVQGFRFD